MTAFAEHELEKLALASVKIRWWFKYDNSLENMHQEINKIKSKQDFLNFLSLYIQDFRNNKDSWENTTIDSFLEGMESWIEDMEGYYENMNLPLPENVDWKTFADILFAAKMYE